MSHYDDDKQGLAEWQSHVKTDNSKNTTSTTTTMDKLNEESANSVMSNGAATEVTNDGTGE